MYRPDRDTRATGPDTPTELQAKRELMRAFEELRVSANAAKRTIITATVQRLEALLEAELYRGIRELKTSIAGAGPPNKRMQADGRFRFKERWIVQFKKSPQLMRGPLDSSECKPVIRRQ